MAKHVRDLMTANPACCSPNTTLDQVAKLMIQNDCGEIPIINSADVPIGVVTDRDIVCRSVAEGENPTAHTAESVMTQPVITISADATLDEVMSVMREHQIRRVPVVDGDGCCTGIIAQADVVSDAPQGKTADLVRDISRDMGRVSH